jgi:hypothetical protein
LAQPDKSAVAEHSISRGHRIQIQNTNILSNNSRYMDRLIKEAIEIELHPNNMTGRMVSFLAGHGNHLSTPWKHVDSHRTGVVGTSVLLSTTQPSA